MKNKSLLLTESDRDALRSGDIIFIAIRSPVYRYVAETCRSWDSHVGIIFREPDGSLVVAESRVPFASYGSLDRFLARADGGKFAIRRLHGGVTDAQAAKLRAECDRRMGRVYHFGFDFDSRLEFCSKLVYCAYREALGVEVGRLETFDELLKSNPTAPLGFWRAWFLGNIPWQRRTITPTSQLLSPKCHTVLAANV